MNTTPIDQTWFEMRDIRRRRLENSVWIPLRRVETIKSEGTPNRFGLIEELACAGSLAVFNDQRAIGEKLGWMEIGLIHEPRAFAFDDGRYKPAETYLWNDKINVGVELVLFERLNHAHREDWLLNQDVSIALGLLREGDVWLRADEGYVEVVRLRRDQDGNPIAMEMRAEHLRDYLCARGMALRVAEYLQRTTVVADKPNYTWDEKGQSEESPSERHSMRVFTVDADSGGPYGGGVAVMRVWRTDVDPNEDVPVMSPETSENTDFESHSFEREGTKAFRCEGELWRQTWIEPATISERIKHDAPAEPFNYLISASGERQNSIALNDEDVGRWLWFRPEVIEANLAFRGSSLTWYTRDTGEVRCSPDYRVHFGINAQRTINVYAADIAKLPSWQQRVWVGNNVVPDGPVSSELLDSQMKADPANTEAPESRLRKLLDALDGRFKQKYGAALFRPHDNRAEILGRVSRFRGLTQPGVYELAKDIARLTADSIDIGSLRRVVKPAPTEKWGSLKHLEHALRANTDQQTAYKTLSPLFGIYELRLADAHLPTSKLKDVLAALSLDPTKPPYEQALGILDRTCQSLEGVLLLI